MACSPIERARICGELKACLQLLHATLDAAEEELLEGSSDARILLRLAGAAGSAIAQLEVAKDILTYATIHGPGPHDADELSRALGHELATVEHIIDQLSAEGILNPRHTP